MKTVLLSLLAVVFSAAFINPASAGKKEKITIQTSAQCGGCETRITKAVEAVDGVKRVAFNMADKSVTVTYDAAVTNADAIRNAITAVGYDADGKPADHAAYHKLPACCQKGGHSH